VFGALFLYAVTGVALLRSVEYFGGNGALTPLVTLAAGCAGRWRHP